MDSGEYDSWMAHGLLAALTGWTVKIGWLLS